MAKGKHPLFDAHYDCKEDGTIQVTSGGVAGVFRRNGEWVSGELKWADPHYCQWLFQKSDCVTLLRNPLVGR